MPRRKYIKIDFMRWPEPGTMKYALYVAAWREKQSRKAAYDMPLKSDYFHGEANAFEVIKGVIEEALINERDKINDQ